jgi:hypothetical protein
MPALPRQEASYSRLSMQTIFGMTKSLRGRAFASDLSIEAVFGRVEQFIDMDCRIAEPHEIKQKSKSFVGVSKDFNADQEGYL